MLSLNTLEIFLRAVIIAFSVMAVWATMLDGNIFEKVRWYGDRRLTQKFQKPLYDCPICMVPWWGTPIYCLFWEFQPANWAAIILIAMGLNTFFVKMFHKD